MCTVIFVGKNYIEQDFLFRTGVESFKKEKKTKEIE